MRLTITEPPFEARSNPSEPAGRSGVATWLAAWGAAPIAAERVGRADVARIAGLTLPDASTAVLAFATRLWAFAILLDDELDLHGAPGDVIDAVTSGGAGRSALHRAYREITGAVAALTDDETRRRRLLGHLTAAIEGKRVERRAGEAATVAEYLAARRASSLGDVLVDLIELPLPGEAPDAPAEPAVPDVPEYRRLVQDTLDASRIVNDILSARKELADEQAPISIVALMRADADEPLPSSVARADDVLRATLRRMLGDHRTVREAARADPARTGGSARCADGCTAFVRGVFDWHLQVARYRDPEVIWQIRPLD